MINDILFIDSEGGHGGSSNSLFALIYGIKTNNPNIKITVLCRLKSNLISAYKKLGVKAEYDTTLPKLSAVNSYFGNIIDFIRFKLFIWPKSYKFRKELLKNINKYNFIHFNHESLFYLSAYIKKNCSAKISGHVRTLCPLNIFSKYQLNIYFNSVHLVTFISKNEYVHSKKFNLDIKNYQICFNPTLQNIIPSSKQVILKKDLFKVAIIGNFSLERGIDRVFSIANKLSKHPKIVFIVIGDKIVLEKIPKSLKLGFKKGDDLSYFTKKIGLENKLKFIGFKNNPHEIISKCDVILRLSRTNSPWARDIIEGFALKKPVLACGSDNTFIKNNITGVLINTYNEEMIVKSLIHLSKSPRKVLNMGNNAFQLINRLCNPKKISEQMLEFWKKNFK